MSEDVPAVQVAELPQPSVSELAGMKRVVLLQRSMLLMIIINRTNTLLCIIMTATRTRRPCCRRELYRAMRGTCRENFLTCT